MGAFYGRKILDGEINKKTGLPWTINDVPSKWVNATRMWLEANPSTIPDDTPPVEPGPSEAEVILNIILGGEA